MTKQEQFFRGRVLKVAVSMACLCSPPVFANPDSGVFTLGMIEVSAPGTEGYAVGTEQVSEEYMRQHQALDAAQALQYVPGVTLAQGSRRAESRAFIRGFDARQVTLSVDGIPVYLPYDGNIDLGRFLTADLSGIVITKGLGSLLYGPNNLGGTINLVTRRPEDKLSGLAGGSVVLGDGGLFTHAESLHLGSRLNDRFYIAAGVAHRDSEGFPLAADFTPTADQPAGERIHAGSRDTNTSLKLGYTPNATDEYTLSWFRVDGRKGAPPYAGSVSGNVVWWDWPQWDKESLYYIGHTALGTGYIKTRVFHDTFRNALTAFDDASLTRTAKKSSFKSRYDDYGQGASIEGGLPVGSHMLKGLLFYKQDVHREIDLAKDGKAYDSPWLRHEARTVSSGVEDVRSFSPHTHVTFGYRFDRFKVDQVQEYADKAMTTVRNMETGGSETADNLLLSIDHRIGAHTLRGGIAQKTRFPTLKESFSYRLGRAIPNPELGPEKALHTEIGSSGMLAGAVRYDIALYHADLSDAIESVAISPTLQQMQNVGSARNYGAEARIDVPLGDRWALYAQYAWLKRTLDAEGLVPTGTPEHQLYASMSWFPDARMEVDLDLEVASGRETTTDGLRPAGGYTLVHLRTSYDLNRHVTLYGGLYNVFDRNYAINEGEPMPGRTLHLSMNVAF